MNDISSTKLQTEFIQAKRLSVFLLAVCILLLAGCFSSTKVYNADKNILYKGDIYNIANTQRISPRIEGTLSNGDVKSMKGMDKKAVQALLEESSPVMVSMVVDMDSRELVYERKSISKYSEYSSMKKRFEKAMSRINKFMANKKTTQLKL